MPDYRPLWKWIREREEIRRRKEVDRASPPWTNDPILRKYRFCNVRREDDRVTRWVRKNIREPWKGHSHLWFMLCIARYINWPDTLDELMKDGVWPDRRCFEPSQIATILNYRQSRGDKLYTGAYMISAPHEKGANKQDYIAAKVLGPLWESERAWEYFARAPNQRTIYGAHKVISSFNGWGNFMAYQAIVDMRFTRILDRASDREWWAAAGPGTIRGLNRLHGRDVGARLDQDQAVEEMREIFPRVGPETGVVVDFSDIPNVLCETDKYLRLRSGQGRVRALYVPGRGY